MSTAKTTTKKRSDALKEDLSHVRIVARTGRLPIVSDDVEWINQNTTRKVPGIVLEFGDNGVCELHPIRHAKEITAFREWMADGTDERIHELGVFEMAKNALLPPFPKWNTTAPDKLPEMVEALGLDPEMCLTYELQRGDDARSKVVKALEAKVDAPPADDPLSEPEL